MESIEEFKPDVYMDIHSGMQGLLMPFSFGKGQEFRDDPKIGEKLAVIRELLNDIQDKYCPTCLAGPVFDLLHYESNGGAMDYNFMV
jgi:hypothetical protein